MSKIKRLVIRNCLGIEERSIDVGNVNIISGGNAKGKTTILEAVEKALYNSDRRDQFVRVGADKAYVELETDDGMKVERIVDAEGKSDVKVTIDGIPKRAPQTFLDQLFGVSKERKDVFAFNPVDFMNKPAKEQSKILLSMMPIAVTQEDMLNWFGKVPPVNPNMHGLLVLKELEKHWYDARHEANGAVRATQSEVEALQNQLPDNYDAAKWENTSLMELSDRIREFEKVNGLREKAQELINTQDEKKKAINDKYDLQVKEQEELKDFKVERAQKEIDKQKDSINGEIKTFRFDIQCHEENIQELLKLIEEEKKGIVDLENRIKIKENDLKTLDSSILTTKTESLVNEMNIAIKAIDEKRQQEIKDLDERLKQAESYLAENEDKTDKIWELDQEYKTAEKMKGFVEMAHNLQKVENRLKTENEAAEKYDRFVQFCRNKPAEYLQNTQLPVQGLSINDEGLVTIDGLPLKNLNTAKQVTVCLDIARAYAKDTYLKIINLDKMEHLDPVVRAEFLAQVEADEEFQYFITKVCETLDYERLKKDNPELYERYKSSLDLKIDSK